MGPIDTQDTPSIITPYPPTPPPGGGSSHRVCLSLTGHDLCLSLIGLAVCLLLLSRIDEREWLDELGRATATTVHRLDDCLVP
jgi:hypothetical protein